MKKLFFAIVVMAMTAGFVSCDPDAVKCYEVTTTTTILDVTTSTPVTICATKTTLDAYVEKAKAAAVLLDASASVTYKQVAASECNGCDAAE